MTSNEFTDTMTNKEVASEAAKIHKIWTEAHNEERRTILAWLRERSKGMPPDKGSLVNTLIEAIERGEHAPIIGAKP